MTMVGCKPATDTHRLSSASATTPRSEKAAANSYERAQKALFKGELADALAAMELAVAQSPQDAGYRKGLAELYLKSGRFVSAETTYADVVALNPGDANAAFYRVIAQLAQGKNEQAIAELAAMDASVAPADLGLAYALAGETRRAIEILEPAARALDSTAKVRQNLALAYAFAGDWKRARTTASQDVSPKDLAKRLQQWAELASPTVGTSRVASLLGVTPVADPGQPAQLALAPVESAPVYAEAEAPKAVIEPTPAPAPEAIVPVTPVVVAQNVTEPAPAPAPAPVEAAPVATPVEVAQAPVAVAELPAAPPAVEVPVAPTPVAESDPVVAQVRYAAAAKQLVEPVDASRTIVPTPIPAYIAQTSAKRTGLSRGYGRYVVQLGAFASPAQVERAWAQAVRRYRFGADQEPLSTTVQIPGKGKFHRLAVAGFSSHGAAARLCQSIRARSGACFVRTIAGDAPVQWASRYSRKA
jgi:Flp pilus assembly protein TadD